MLFLVTIMAIKAVGFEHLKNEYSRCKDFNTIYTAKTSLSKMNILLSSVWDKKRQRWRQWDRWDMSHYMCKYMNSLQNYSIGSQMLASVVVWKRHIALSRVVQCVSAEGLWRPWFLLCPLLSLLGIRVSTPKLKGILWFCFCIKFGFH